MDPTTVEEISGKQNIMLLYPHQKSITASLWKNYISIFLKETKPSKTAQCVYSTVKSTMDEFDRKMKQTSHLLKEKEIVGACSELGELLGELLGKNSVCCAFNPNSDSTTIFIQLKCDNDSIRNYVDIRYDMVICKASIYIVAKGDRYKGLTDKILLQSQRKILLVLKSQKMSNKVCYDDWHDNLSFNFEESKVKLTQDEIEHYFQTEINNFENENFVDDYSNEKSLKAAKLFSDSLENKFNKDIEVVFDVEDQVLLIALNVSKDKKTRDFYFVDMYLNRYYSLFHHCCKYGESDEQMQKIHLSKEIVLAVE